MSGRGIGSIGAPRLAFRIDRSEAARRCGFETLAQSHSEDRTRARRLRNAVRDHPQLLDTRAALALAVKLERAGAEGKVPASFASHTHMRGERINVMGAVWQLTQMVGAGNVHAFTIVPRSWEIPAHRLSQRDPRKLMAALRAALHRMGSGQADGWMIAFLHGEWDSIGQVFRLHVHGLAYGPMVDVIDRLRKLPNYKTIKFRRDGRPQPVYRPVRISRLGLTNLPSPLTYLLQSFWPAKALIISDDTRRIRGRKKRRIAEPYHSQVLLWLDRWKTDDLTLMIGLRVTAAGLMQTKSVS